MSSAQSQRPVVGPTWVVGSLLVGTIVAVLILAGGELELVIAVGLSLASVLLAIGFAAEKVVLALGSTPAPSGRTGEPPPAA